MSGKVLHISRDEYDRLPGVNWSRLKHLAKSPAHYQHNLLVEQADTGSKRVGRGTHHATLEPDLFRGQYVVWDGGRRAGKEWEAFRAKHADREILTEDEHAKCLAIQGAVRNHPVAGKYLAGGRSEVSVTWEHVREPIGGLSGFTIACKGRLDFVHAAGTLVDLKTTRDASPDAFSRDSWRFRYHTQAAYYRDGYAAATGTMLPVVIVAVETEAPYVVQVYRVPEEVLAVGRAEYGNLLDRLQFCRDSNFWPGYGDGELELALPRWAMPSDDEDVEALGLDLPGGT